jgi:hypothetical protein
MDTIANLATDGRSLTTTFLAGEIIMADNIVRVWGSKTIRHREDGYLSATDMAKANGKRVNNWLRLESTSELLSTWKTRYSDSRNGGLEPVSIVQGGIPEEQGTWLNPKVAIQFAQWCSADFALQVSDWVEELMTKGAVSIANQDPRLVLLEQLSQLTHQQIALEQRQKELDLENQRIRLDQQQLKAEQNIQAEAILQHDAEIGRLFQPDGALISLAGCLNLHGKSATASQLSQAGRAASKAYREKYGKEPERIGDARYGTVGVYPQAIAMQALKDYGYLD